MHAARIASLALLLAAGTPLHAQGADPLKSPECGAALGALQSARTEQADAARVERLRSQAAATCLGTSHPTRNTARTAQAPISVPPPQIDVTPVPPPSLAPAVPLPPPVEVGRLPPPASCDAGGCWVNGGDHLQYVPPTLQGPRGLCSTQGGLVYCP
jgi:hypothetical protein